MQAITQALVPTIKGPAPAPTTPLIPDQRIHPFPEGV